MILDGVAPAWSSLDLGAGNYRMLKEKQKSPDSYLLNARRPFLFVWISLLVDSSIWYLGRQVQKRGEVGNAETYAYVCT